MSLFFFFQHLALFLYHFSSTLSMKTSEGAVTGNDTMTRDIFFINLITFQASVWFLVSSPHG